MKNLECSQEKFSAEQGIINVLSAYGLFPQKIIFDRNIHRFTTKKDPSGKAGWYVAYHYSDDRYGVAFGDWRTGLNEKWSSYEDIEGRYHKDIIHDQGDENELEQELERQREYVLAAQEAKRIWDSSSSDITDHPYLRSKKIQAYNLREKDGKLLVPIKDSRGTIWSLQYIYQDGQQKNLSHGKIKGTCFGIPGKSDIIYICNGYASGATIHEATGNLVVCAFNAENILDVAQNVRNKYPHVKIVIAWDNDQRVKGGPGIAKARAAALKVGGLVAVPTFFDASAKPIDFNELYILEGVDSVRSQLECTDKVVAKETDWTQPSPIPTPNSFKVMGFDTATMLPASLAEWAEDSALRIGCPIDFIAVSIVVGLGALIGKHIAIRPRQFDDWQVVPNLWGIIIGRPSSRKSSALRVGMTPLWDLQTEKTARHQDEVKQWEKDKQLVQIKNKALQKQIDKAVSRGEQDRIISLFEKMEEVPEKPYLDRLIGNDTTEAKLCEILSKTRRGLLVFRDELNGWLHQLELSHSKGTREFFLEGWAGTNSHSVDRVKRGELFIKNHVLSILGGIQPGPFKAYINQCQRGMTGDDGFIQRFQLAVWPEMPTQNACDVTPDKHARETAYSVYRRLCEMDLMKIKTESDPGTREHYLRFTSAAADIFSKWMSELMDRLRTDYFEPSLEAHFSKYPSLIPSLALIFHLTENPGGGPVGIESLKMALRWAKYLSSHAEKIYKTASTPMNKAAHDLSIKIMHGYVASPFTARDVYVKSWQGLDKASVQQGIDALIGLNWIRAVKVGPGPRGGRPTVKYEINPFLYERKQVDA
jgi:putative DNA primase/helicase